MTPINHLRNRIDELSWRTEQAHDAEDVRRLTQECNELERALQAHESQLRLELADMESAKQLLHRLKARL
ncbi:MAG: hypothetical protein ABI648_18020 [Betaproteobacteria bacterium]